MFAIVIEGGDDFALRVRSSSLRSRQRAYSFSASSMMRG
jgi:hypothetical protein